MARAIARANAASNDLDRKFKELEKRLDKGTAHYRLYYSDLKSIQELLDAKKIDKAHAEMWAAASKEHFDKAEAKRQAAKPQPQVEASFAAMLKRCFAW